MPKVSVLMPIYKTNELHLRECIDSILNQSFTDFEFLILNDSPECSYLDSLVLSYADKRIIYVKNDKNMGITPSRNKLLDMAKGEYLAVMDHDDVSLPERFKKQVDFLENNSEFGVVSYNYKEIDSNKERYYSKYNNYLKDELLISCCIIHPAAMIRKSVLFENNIRYEEHFSPAEDYALWMRLIGLTNFFILPDFLFLYRSHLNNTSKIQKEKMKNADKEIKKMIRKGRRIKFLHRLIVRYLDKIRITLKTSIKNILLVLRILKINKFDTYKEFRLFGITIFKKYKN